MTSCARIVTRCAALLLLCGALFFALAHPAQAQTPCPTLTSQVTVATSSDPGFVGLYKYTVTLTWDVGTHDPSHVDVLVGLNDCVCVCDPRLFKFGAPAGLSTGVNGSGPCQVPYSGAYVCKGDPSIADMTGPAIKFTPDETLCSTDETGSGTFVFYSPLPPGPPQYDANAIAIKHGTSTCYGPLYGPLPLCDCSVPAQATTWGKMKDIYR